MQGKGYILVEGHGEVHAVENLVVRLTTETGNYLPWATPLRWKNLHQWVSNSGKGGLKRGANYIRSKKDVGALLILRDEDDACPKELAPQTAEKLRGLNLPFPVAYVLLHPEYEVLFLPCLHRMPSTFADGRPAILPNTRWDGDSWEARRGVKEWLSGKYPPGRIYKPTLDQLPLTRQLDFDLLRAAEVPCFGSLERALAVLGRQQGRGGGVYPGSQTRTVR